ncbi:mucin-5AC-like isoform X1 [Penaeus chinensis]|uniref:mucin-5AC-like isoform X1 n=1 Tax=Penaeus chinensis TaxID=139456 RepID=UPI001FB84021|nr:mucin-5AC-like isoform X1 [Penaeus chinensis]
MDGARLSADTRNIPHMQLFIHLKQKFPDLKDNDVNESIQKYGLDRERCEEELSQKTHIHHGGYYGPWGRPGSSLSLTSPSRVTSPIRTGIPPTPTTPVITSSTAVTPLLPHTNATHHVFGPLQSSGYLMYSYGPGMVAGPGPVYTSPNTTTIATSPVLFQPPVNSPADYGWHPSVSNGVRGAAVQPLRHLIGGGSGSGPDTPYSSREASKSRSSTPVLPNSAPVVPNSFDPFSACENHPVLPERRKSAETQFDGRRGLFYNVHNLEQHFERLNDSAHHSPTPPLNNTIDSLSTPITTTTTTITTTTSNCVDPSSSSNSSSVSRPPPGPRHVSSIYLTPVLPHGAHHIPGPPSSDGTVSVCGRSYTSVNLQLRQPSTDPQPPIQIRSSGSSLTYSTSSLDHRHGSRSSLQISIGPTGGTISAMRTNLDNKNSQANTAFHIQYSSGANGGSTPTGAAFPTTEDIVGQEGVQGQTRRPQTWYMSDPPPTESRPRKSSLPECVGPPVSLHPLHYPPSTDAPLGYSEGEPVWAVPPARPDMAYTQALVQEQNLRKEKLNAELAKQIEEKGKLEKEVDMMRRELEWRERQRKQNADRNTKMIEDVQQENQRLQSECYEMENKIFRLAPELEPEYPLHVPSNLPFSEAPLIPQLTRPSSGSSLGGSGTGTPQTPHTPHTPHTSQTPGVFIPPTRPALPPPLPPTSVPNHGYCVVQGVPGDTVDEVGPKWACTKCTFINHPDMNKCEMCDYPRFTIGTAPSNHAAHPPNHQGPCYCHRHHTPGSQEYPGWAMV